MILETLNKENNLTGALHILNFDQENTYVNIGRGSESDIRISDISVSRCHTKIKLGSEGFFVEDNKSKFGTLVRVREGLTVESEAVFLQ